jgi:transposase
LEVSHVTGYSRIWIYQLVRRYNEKGLEAIADQRRQNSGKESLLSDEQQAQLWQVLQYRAPDGWIVEWSLMLQIG